MRIAENFNAFNESPTSYDCINIAIDGSPSSDLEFFGLEKSIQEVLNLDKKVCIELFLDLNSFNFSFYNEIEFAIRKRSLEVLVEKLSFVPEEKISHIIVYRGSIDFSSFIKKNALATLEYEKWKENFSKIEEDHLLQLFSAKLLSSFFHSLCSVLPDHIKGAVLLTMPYLLENAKIAELISEETFSHLEIGIKNPNFFVNGICWGNGSGKHHLSFTPASFRYKEEDVKTAVILPFLGNCKYSEFERVCKNLEEKSIAYKIIEENLTNEKWFDIDNILFDQENISFDGKRMLDGFVAAGGKIYPFAESLIEAGSI
jgi:hypothetical protein